LILHLKSGHILCFSHHTRAPVKKLKVQLRQSKKDLFVPLYLLDIKEIVDSLAVIGSPLSTDEHIEAILDGLSEEYDCFITSVPSRLDPYPVKDIEALLLAREERLEKNKVVNSSLFQANFSSASNNQNKHHSFGPPQCLSAPPLLANRFFGPKMVS